MNNQEQNLDFTTTSENNKLPASSDVSRILIDIHQMTAEQCLEQREYTLRLFALIQQYADPEQDEDDFELSPEEELTTLLKVQSLVGSLLGLCVALSRRIKYLTYMELDAEPLVDRKKKYTQGDKDNIARGRVADLEGLESSLDIVARNLDHKVYVLRNSVRSRY